MYSAIPHLLTVMLAMVHTLPVPSAKDAQLASHSYLFHRHRLRHGRQRQLFLREALAYLRHYGYLGSGALTTQLVHDALADFQSMVGTQQTGTLDSSTLHAMKQPRCGNADVVGTGHERRKRFAQISKWDDKIDSKDVLRLRWYIQKFSDDIPRENTRAVVARAFDLWANQVPIPSIRSVRLQFEEAGSPAEADINIVWADGNHGDEYPFDGAGATSNILAHTFYPNYRHTGTLNGDIHLDDHERWTLKGTSQEGVNFPYVLVHEIGHALGLGHSKWQEAIMNPIYKQHSLEQTILDIDDKCAVNWNYVGPTNTCLFVWLMVELLPRTQNAEQPVVEQERPDGSLTKSETPGLEQKLNATLSTLQDSDIPTCATDSSVKTKYEILLEQKLAVESDAAKFYGPVICNFLNGLSKVVKKQPDDGDDRVEGVEQHEMRQPIESRSRREAKEEADADVFGGMRPDGRTIYDADFYDSRFFEELFKLFDKRVLVKTTVSLL